ncbi:T3SS effector HopA1 family protein [Fischerella thermalis]|jgi:hypothetical protein|uniref:Uncharacterized protein n=1 Tax=Fischerella thermalis JSC-11 TaxID=741277 RepID=G6FQL2_9CYAN|nr:T3SS effector HopA1 family protein [Fischerella thermalis]PMB07685.1 hypothetical protein CEN49_12045 [Fischerella thermalis CCMEE 5273]PMB13323.1 hypothetical protein CI592_01040 [Fischerella thermalis CCMEE 5328]EHC18097.1 hypothetical protein FJSC11DRAFT_1159 [Fischerella thermalis JSC-11]PLZ09341.1 hypothetical protein CBP17_14040 [Fischerella thermalis WC114]PLZ11633.1 hypothetical protein CBP19_12690 [Fischerella thermalis WC1110]
MLDCSDQHLQNSLLDIADNIQIEANFCIYHPNYQSFALPNQLAQRFQKHSQAIQYKYLTLLLRNFIYGIYYNGSLQSVLAVNAKPSNFLPHKSLENNSVLGIDWQLYEQLHSHNHGTGYYDPGWQVLRREPDGSLAVSKGGLTLHIESEHHLEPMIRSVRVGDLINIWMPKNRLQNGCYVAVSNVAQKLGENPDSDLGEGRIYFNITPSGAIALMESLTLQLNTAGIAFSFQVPYNPSAYRRFDSAVLYFERHNYWLVREVLQAVYKQQQSHFYSEIPLFTKYLAPGLSLAEEPAQKFVVQESFGINRCQIVANALLEAWQKGQNSTQQRIQTICQHFARLGIDLQRPYLNPSSEDVYIPLM